MKTTARAAQLLGVKVVTCFLGSPIWAMWYSFPQTTPEMVEAGFQKIKELWTPIFDVYDECGVKLALEVHPTEIAFDYWSTKAPARDAGLSPDARHQLRSQSPALAGRGSRDLPARFRRIGFTTCI